MPYLTNLGGNYALSLTNPPTKLESLGVPDPMPGDMVPYTATANATGSGKTILLGRPVVKWHFGMLDQKEYNTLVDFVKNGPVRVYIRTRVPSGVVQTYHTFYALMQYPSQATSRAGGLWENVEITFTDLVNAPPT